MGLLARARLLDDGPRVRKRSCDEKARDLLDGFALRPGTMDYPGQVYTLLRELLGFRKGALLLPSPEENLYLPWISTGFDRTTARRLRIPRDAPYLNRDVTEEEILPLLSNREKGLISRPLLLLLGSDAAPADAKALLFTTEAPGMETEEEQSDWQKALERVSTAICGEWGHAMREEPPESTQIADWLPAWGDAEGVLTVLDMAPAIDTLLNSVDGMETYRARKTVTALAKRIIGRMGRFAHPGGSHILIMFPADRMPDKDLYLHQFHSAFISALPETPQELSFPAEFYNWPRDKDTFEEQRGGRF